MDFPSIDLRAWATYVGVLVGSTIYIVVLFRVARWGDAQARESRRKTGSLSIFKKDSFEASFLYAMGLAIHNTTWSFFGFSAQYIKYGVVYLATYGGPALLLLVGSSQLNRIIEIARQQRAISIADFIASRYGKRQYIATIVTFVALLAIIPYISIQLSFIGKIFGGLFASGTHWTAVYFWPALGAAFIAIFSYIFGVQHVRAHHQGMMLAIAMESIVKLALFIMIAIAAFVMLPLHVFNTGNVLSSPLNKDAYIWFLMVVMGMSAFMCMPHMYYVLVVANQKFFDYNNTATTYKIDQTEGRRWHTESTVWYVLYLSCLAALVLSLTLLYSNPDRECSNCMYTFDNTDIDKYMLVMFNILGPVWTIAGFLVCISAATGMTIIASIATSTMICNVNVMPIVGWVKRNKLVLLRRMGRGILNAFRSTNAFFEKAPLMKGALSYGDEVSDEYKLLLDIRRMSVLFVFTLTFSFQIAHDTWFRNWTSAELGLLSFVIIAQLAPSFFIGLNWAGGHHAGVAAGVISGITIASIYVWTVSGEQNLLQPLINAGYWSLMANTLAYVLVSRVFSWWEKATESQSELDAVQARAFVYGQSSRHKFPFRRIERITVKDLRKFMADFGPDAARKFEQRITKRNDDGRKISDSDLVDYELILDMHDIIADVRGPIRAIRYIMHNLHIDGVTPEQIEQILAEALGSRVEDPHSASTPQRPDVFICYAIGDEKLGPISDFLIRHDLRPRTLEHDPVLNRPILERLPDYADVAYAIAILTPTDYGARKDEQPRYRPRQNVVLELGYFVGCLGRKKVCAIKSDDAIEVPSDFGGVVIVDFDNKWEAILLQEIKAAGVLPMSVELKPAKRNPPAGQA